MGSTEPTVRALTERGATWDDPSEDLLLELLRDIERGDELFVVVERLGTAQEAPYMQVIRLDGGSYGVERREGDADSHVHAVSSDLRHVHRILTTWAWDLDPAEDEEWWDGAPAVDLDWRPGFGATGPA